MNPDSTYYTSAPFHYQPDPYTAAWDVQTYDHTYAGSISVHSATLASDNTVYAQLTLDVGPDKVAEMAHRLGIRSHLDVVPAMGLGADAISPLEEASAYATLAAGGIYSKPMAIRKVVLANGKEDTDAGWGKPQRQARDQRRRRLRGDEDPRGQRARRHRRRRLLRPPGRGQDRARRTTTRTPGSRATCRSSRRRSGSATRRARSRCEDVHGSSVQGGTFPASIWRLFMETAMDRAPRRSAGPTRAIRSSGSRSRRASTARASGRPPPTTRRPRRRPARRRPQPTTTTAAADHDGPHRDHHAAAAAAPGGAATATAAGAAALRHRPSRRPRHHPAP